MQEALEHLRQQLPFRLQGIDSHNGSEFINDHLRSYGTTQAIQYTEDARKRRMTTAHRAKELEERAEAPRLSPV